MKLRPVKIYIDGVLVAKHMSDKPLDTVCSSFVKTRRVIGIHLDGRTVKAEDPRGMFFEQLVSPPKGRRIVQA